MKNNQVNIRQGFEHDNDGLVGRDAAAGATWLLKNWKDLSSGQHRELSPNASACFRRRFEMSVPTNRLRALLEQEFGKTP
jgi:hypothetical protein